MNQKIRAILIDDEPFCTEGLVIDLQSTCPEVEVVAVCNSAKEGLQQIITLHPDVILTACFLAQLKLVSVKRSINDILFGLGLTVTVALLDPGRDIS